MQVGFLGPLEVVVDGHVVDIGGARLRALLIRLALDAGRTVSVDALSDALWPHDVPADRANALQTLVSRLRRALSGTSALRFVPGGYSLDLPPEAVDALRFERLAREGRRALRDGEPRVAASLLHEALRLWRGQALADVAEAQFAAAVGVRLEELRLAAMEDRIEAEIEVVPERSHLVVELRELAAAHPLRERPRQLLVKVLHVEGRPAEALSAYEEFRRLLADELGTDPGPGLQDMHLAVLRGEAPRDRPGTRRRRGNLRAPLTSFVGRADELAQIVRQLKHGRLVTLVGAGGAGKTRLATAFAESVADQVPGGTWLVELASVTDADDVPRAVVGALGLRGVEVADGPAGPATVIDSLVDALCATETLIVLDNCEHVINAAAQLAVDLLGRCPRLQMLATSREPLGVPGEALCPVPPLPVPPAAGTADDILAFPSVRLFAARVTAGRPDFKVADHNAAAVAEICRRLDGLPLAIELAAARLRSLSVEQLAARLDDRFRVLTGGSRTVLPRHQTLRAVVAWSWRLLDADERTLAERLAVFTGNVSVESAEAVCAGGEVAGDAVLDLLAALVDKSLVQVVEGNEPRYRMLETIREYGLERLAETGEIADVRTAHAGYFLGLAERAEPHLRGRGQLAWLARLRAERTNLLAALRFAADTADADTAVRFAAALGLFWTVQGNHAEAAGRLRSALDIAGEANPRVRTIATAFYLFNVVLSAGQGVAGLAVDEMRTWLRGADHDAEHPLSALSDAALALVSNNPAAGVAALDRHPCHPDAWTRGMLLLMRAFLQGNDGDMHLTRQTLAAAVATFREAQERWGLAMSLTAMAEADAIIGDPGGAITALEESIRLIHDLDPRDNAILQRVSLAVARTHTGDVQQARTELLQIVQPDTVTSSARYLVLARITLGNLARYDSDLEEAARQYETAREDLNRVTFSAPLFRAILGSAMGHLAAAKGDLAAAERHLGEAFRLAIDAPDMPIVAVVGVAAARLRLRKTDAPGAAAALGAAHTLRGAPDGSNIEVVRLVQELREVLDEHTYEAAYARGRGLDRVGALAFIEARIG